MTNMETTSKYDPFFVNQRMAQMPNYYQWMYSEVEKYIGEEVLDYGCGVGIFFQFLKNKKLIMGIDADERIIHYLQNQYAKEKNYSFSQTDLVATDLSAINLPKVDTIIAMDIIEHIKNDLDIIKFFYHLLKPGGHLIIKVPAFSCLYCDIDRDVGHYRRYSKKDLIALSSKTGFKIVKNSYINMIGFPLYFWKGKILKIRGPFSNSLNNTTMKIINAFLPIYSFLIKLIYKPFGLSIIAVLKK